jgi:hypothetical protein
MEDGNLAVLVDAKTEYTKQLVNILKSNIYFIFLEIYEDCKELCKTNKTPKKVFFEFQQKMRDIPSWNTEVINSHCENIVKNSRCDWIDELITAVFVSHTRILTSINFTKTKGKIDLNIPKTSHFIHKCFIDIARYFWKNSYLFDENVNKFDYQKNRRESELLIETSINETIRRELPVKDILRKYLQNDEPEPESPIKTMVLKELENCSNEKLNKLMTILDSTSTESLSETAVEPLPEVLVEDPVEVLVEDPVEAPVEAPVDAPVEAPVDAPVEALPEVPVAVPVEALPEAPVAVPVEALPEAPVAAPLDVLVEAPVEAPVAVPVAAPVEAPVEAPVAVPVAAPVEAPVEAPTEFANKSFDLESPPLELSTNEEMFKTTNLDDTDSEVIQIKTKSKPKVEVNLQDAFPELNNQTNKVQEITVNLDDSEPTDLEQLDIQEINFDSLVEEAPQKRTRNYSFFD